MAAGDVVGSMSQIVAGGGLSYSPAAGVHAVITTVSSEALASGNPEVEVRLRDTVGGYTSALIDNTSAAWARPLKIAVKNGLGLNIQNANAAAKYLAYSGVLLK